MNKQGTVSVFKRLVLMFLALVVLIYIVLAALFVAYVKQQREIELSGLETRVTNSAAAIEQQIYSVRNIEIQLAQDSRIARLSQGLYSDDYEKFQMILEVLTVIQSTHAINGIIDDIIILFPNEGFELSADNGYNRVEYDMDEYSARREYGIGKDIYLNGNKMEISIAYPLVVSLDESYVPNYEIRIVFSSEYLNRFTGNFRGQPLEGSFWAVADEHVSVLWENNDSEHDLSEFWHKSWKKKGMPSYYTEEIICEGVQYLFVSQKVEDTSVVLVTYHDSSIVAWKIGNTLLYMALVFIALGFAMGMIVVWANNSVSKPIYQIMKAFEKVQAGELGVRIFHSQNDEFGYIYDSFNNAVNRIEILIESIKEQKELLRSAELMQLQSQINPHFLYNSFYNIKFLAHNEEYEQIDTLVTALAKYYRFMNKETNQNIPLKDEVAHMENYIEIQQMRFGDKITVHKDALPEEVAEMMVPKLILQPIIENAYTYGLISLLTEGKLWIRYRLEGDYLLIDIEDNGQVMNEAKLFQMRSQLHTYEGDAINHALTNIQRRLMLAFSDNCGVELAIGESGGLIVTLRMNTKVSLPD